MRDEILVLLEDGGHTVSELAAWLKADTLAVIHELKALKMAGLVMREDLGADGFIWSLSVLPPGPAPRPASKPLRQPIERPQRRTVTPEDQKPSFWVGLSREELAAAIREREQIRNGKAGTITPTKDFE